MNIVVGLDFSECSYGLVDSGAELAGRLGATLTLVHALDADPGLDGDSRARLRDDATTRLAELAKRVPAGTPVTLETSEGAPGDVLLASAARADMIVVGTHGRTGVRRLLLGSVAEHVIRRAEVPVVSVRTRHRVECTASSCDACTSHLTPARQQARAELDG